MIIDVKYQITINQVVMVISKSQHCNCMRANVVAATSLSNLVFLVHLIDIMVVRHTVQVGVVLDVCRGGHIEHVDA